MTDETQVERIERFIRVEIANAEREILLRQERIIGMRKALECVSNASRERALPAAPRKMAGEN